MTPRRFPFLLLALAAAPLAAQQKPLDLNKELDEFVNTDQIQAASKRVQDVASAPADVVVIRSSELKAMGYRTLGEALGGVLGFSANQDHAYQGMGSAGTYTLGDQNTRLLVLLDGHALNSPAEVGSSKVGEDFGMPLELVDHIELVRGPASSLYGNNAFQALVNVSTVFAAGSVPSAFQGAASGGKGGLGELWAQGTFAVKGVSTSLMLSGFRRAGTAQAFPQAEPGTLPSSLDREDRQSAYLYVKGGQWSFAGSMLNRTQLLASHPYGTVSGDPENFYQNRRLSGEFKWEPRTESVKWMFRFFGDENTFNDSLVHLTAAQRDPWRDHDPDRSVGIEAQGRTAIARNLSLTFGTELQSHHYQGDFLSTVEGSTTSSAVSYLTGNTYLEANWDPTPAFSMVAGLQRADWIPSQARSGVDGVTEDLEKKSMSRLTPRVTLIYKPGAADVVKFIYGQGFRFPTLFERYYTDGSSQAPNVSINPEVITSTQLSWSRKWLAGLTTHMAATALTTQNSIVSGSTVIGGNTLLQYQNAPDARKGKTLEAEVVYRRGGTEVSGGAGWYDWTYQGAPLDNASKWNSTFKAIQRLGAWSVAGEGRYVDGRKAAAISANGVREVTFVPANWTLRASLRWDSAGMWAQASVEDLTGSRRRDLVAPEYSPITWMEADGRSLRVTVGFRM